MITSTNKKWKPKGTLFAVADQSRKWDDIEKHLWLFPGIEKVTQSRVPDGTIEGLTFCYVGFSFAILNSLLWEPNEKPTFWFLVWEKEAPESVLQEVIAHFKSQLS
jgi:hypothetical protein